MTGDDPDARDDEQDAELYQCVRCGDNYEPYEVLIKDDFVEISEMVSTKREWSLHEEDNDGFCKPCRMAVTDYGVYLTPSERENLEPKEEVEA